MRRWVVALLAALACACGGRLAPIDGGAPGDGGGLDARSDAGVDAGLDAGDDATFAPDGGDATDDGNGCSYDASEDDPGCTPPADDLLYADPPVVSVAGGSYGAANFVATGPWTADPGMFMWYAGSTIQLLNVSQVMTYGTPQTLIFLVPESAIGQTFTFSVKGHAGNVERTAELTVHVTSCQPWTEAMVCNGYQCDFEPDHCGGLVSCGTCSAPTPYCFLRECVATQPTYCPSGQGTDGMGGCIPCAQTFTCLQCPAGNQCLGVQDVCLCVAGG